jgi:hypothetical protein
MALPQEPAGENAQRENGADAPAQPAAKETLHRLGTSRESAARLGRKAAEAEKRLGIHGVSVSAAPPTAPASSADRDLVEAHFPVHDTPTRADALHRTVELPKPVTPGVADLFNRLFGRK